MKYNQMQTSDDDIYHYSDVIMGTMVFQITRLKIIYSTVYLGADQRKHPSSASLAFLRGIHRWLLNSPKKEPVTRKMFPFDDVIMLWGTALVISWALAHKYSVIIFHQTVFHRSLRWHQFCDTEISYDTVKTQAWKKIIDMIVVITGLTNSLYIVSWECSDSLPNPYQLSLS